MTHPRLLDAYVAAIAVTGAAVTGVVLIAGADELGERPLIALFFAIVLMATERFPLLLLRGEETEGLLLEETFLVAMALVLPLPSALAAFALGATVGNILRRRPLRNTAFNAGQAVLAAALALAVMHAIAPMSEPGFAEVVAAVAGAAVFFAVNTTAVGLVIAMAEGTPFRESVFGALPFRLVIWGGSVSLGLMMGLAVNAYPWVLPCLVAPLAMLYWSFSGHLRAWRTQQRLSGLFDTAMGAQTAASPADVSTVVAEAAGRMLSTNRAEVRTDAPGEDELGAVVTTSGDVTRWLVVADRRGVEPFDAADEDLLRAVAAIGSAAFDRAVLYDEAERERRKVSDIVESSSDGIFSVGPDQRIRSWNPAMERVTGFAAADAVGSACSDVFGPHDGEGHALCGPDCPGRCGTEGPVEVRVTTRQGGTRWMTCTYSPLAEGGYAVVARDVTAEKEAEELKTDFLAMVSHELRTPLTPIKGFLHTLLADHGEIDTATRQDIYGMMLHQTDRLTRLVLDLLDATSLGDPDHLILVDRLDWAATVTDTVALYRREAPERTIELEVGGAVPTVAADAQRAEQILANLLENAFRYSPPGSPITVSLRRDGDHVVTTVTDRGPGVPPADREHIFERFRRLGNHISRPDGGLGLGLYIARRLVEGMGGTISVGDGPESGAAFTFTLPVAADRATASSAQ